MEKTGCQSKGGKARGAEIETHNDHRLAMSFAIAGLAVPGVKIKGKQCVAKSFPEFWETLEETLLEECMGCQAVACLDFSVMRYGRCASRKLL